MRVELDDVEKYLVDGLDGTGSPWATESSRELFHIFSAYIRHRINDYKQELAKKAITAKQRGGYARAESLPAKERKTIARNAANARWGNQQRN